MSVDLLSLDFIDNHPVDAARALEGLPHEDVAGFLARLPADTAARLLILLVPQLAAACLAALSPAAAAAMVQEIPPDRAAALLRRLARAGRNQCLAQLPPARAAALRLALRFPDATIGSVLDPDVLAFPETASVRDVRAALSARGEQPPDQVYVLGADTRLTGVMDVKQLVVADADNSIGGLAQAPEFTFPARASLVSMHDHPAWLKVRIVPVLDRNGILLGVVSRDALSARPGDSAPGASDLADLVYALAETVWDACAEIFVRTDQNPEHKRRSQ